MRSAALLLLATSLTVSAAIQAAPDPPAEQKRKKPRQWNLAVYTIQGMA